MTLHARTGQVPFRARLHSLRSRSRRTTKRTARQPLDGPYIWARVEPTLDPFWGHLFLWIGGGVEPLYTFLLFHVAEGSLPLLETHEVVRLAAFDMFPATGHVEMAAYLRRRRATTSHSAAEQEHQMRQEPQGWGKRLLQSGCVLGLRRGGVTGGGADRVARSHRWLAAGQVPRPGAIQANLATPDACHGFPYSCADRLLVATGRAARRHSMQP